MNSLSETTEIKATEYYYPVILHIVFYKVTQRFMTAYDSSEFSPYLCYGPLNKRSTSHTGTIHFLKVVIRIAKILAQHDLTDVLPTLDRYRIQLNL